MSESTEGKRLEHAEWLKRWREQLDAECRGEVPTPAPMSHDEYRAMLRRQAQRPAGEVRVSDYNWRTPSGRRLV